MACREDQEYFLQIEGASYLWPNQAVASQSESGPEKALTGSCWVLTGFWVSLQVCEGKY